MKPFDILTEFLNDKPEIKLLQTANGQAFVSYLTDIFKKLNMLNKQLQGVRSLLMQKLRHLVSLLFCNYVKRVFQAKYLTNVIG
jgi:hypothetical protein